MNKQKLFLLKNLVNIELTARYKKSLLGNLWFIIIPIIYAGLYYFAFNYVFSARASLNNNILNMLTLFWGVSLHSYLSEILIRSTNLINYNINYVKKVVFPLELLCFRDAITGLVSLSIALIISIFFLFFTLVDICNIMLALLTILPYIVICLGFSLFFTTLGVFIRDLNSLCGVLSGIILFLSPVLYSLVQLPASLACFFYINPLTYPMQTLRELINNSISYEDFFIGYITYSLVAIIFFSISYSFFFKMKKYFADVL